MPAILCCLIAAGVIADLTAAEHGSVPDVKPVREAMRAFHSDPEKVHGDPARLIFRYAEQSKDVELVLNRRVVSFISNQKENFDERSTLLLAFIIGNVESQWAHRQTKDDSYAGIRQVITTYRQLQKKNPKLRIPEVEKFIELNKRGELQHYVENA